MRRPLCRGMRFFTLIWISQVISFLGSGMSGFAIGTNLYRETGSVTLYALIGLSMAVPTILLSPLAGTLADKVDRRLILIVSTLGSMLGTLALFWLVSRDRLTPAHLYAIQAFRACFGTFVWPAFAASTTLIVGKENLSRASGMNQTGGSLSQIFAPFLGGLLVGPLGVEGVLLIDASTFIFSMVVLLIMRFPQPEAKPLAGESEAGESEARASVDGSIKGGLRVGWTFIRERPGMLWLLALFAILNFLIGIVQISITPMILSFTTQRVLGVVMAAAGSGSLVGGILMSVWGGVKPGHRVKVILRMEALAGAVLLLAGLQANAALIGSAAFFFMLGFPIIGGCTQAIWQSKVPPEIQGRVFAVRRMIAGGSMPIAFAVAGPLADFVFEPLLAEGGALAGSVGRWVGVGPGRGIAFSLVLFGLAMVLTTWLGWRSEALRRLEEDIPDAIEDMNAKRRRGLVRRGLARLGMVPTLALFAVLVLAMTATFVAERPPARLTDPALADFSVDRAMEHVKIIAQRPHFTGSQAQREVRDYLVTQLEQLGLETEVQTAESASTLGSTLRVVTVENVVARLPGTGDSRAGDSRAGDSRRSVLLVAHYDSVPSAPGASDNGAAVGVLLETARVLAEEAPLRNDVIFLFSDAEEISLGGARAFVKQHRWEREVAVVLNFDARGHGGPVYMFQTGPNNAWWVRQYSQVVPHPRGSSLFHQIYQKLPNDTDFSVFLKAAYPGFNHAFIEGLTHYHSMLDRPEEVDLRSVGHQGSYALAVGRHFANIEWPAEVVGLDSARGGATNSRNLVFFSLLGALVVRYSATWATVSAVLVVLLFLALITLGLRRRQFGVGGLAQGMLAFFGAAVAIPVAVSLVWFVVRDLASPVLHMGSTPLAYLYMTAFALLALAGFVAIHGFLRTFIRIQDLYAGALMWWVGLAILLSGPMMPSETNFIAVWPLLGGLVSLFYMMTRPNSSVDARPWLTVGLLSLASVPCILLFVPLASALYVGLQSLVQLSGVPLVAVILCFGLLIPQIDLLTGRHTVRIVGLVTLAAVAVLGLAIIQTTGSRPRFNMVAYGHNVDTDEQHWFSRNLQVDDWMRQFGLDKDKKGSFEPFFPLIQRDWLRGAAPRVELPRPGLEVVGQRQLSDEVRDLDIRLTFPGGTTVRTLWFEPPGAVSLVKLKGQAYSLTSMGAVRMPMIQRFPVPEEETWTLRLKVSESVTVHIVDQIEGLPRVPGFKPRPEEMYPAALPFSIRGDVTYVRRSFDLDDVSIPDQQ